MASQLTQEEKIQLAIKALQDGTIPSQRQAALIYKSKESRQNKTKKNFGVARILTIEDALRRRWS